MVDIWAGNIWTSVLTVTALTDCMILGVLLSYWEMIK